VLDTVTDAAGTHEFACNSALQPTTETISSGIMSKVITRGYETSGVIGRYKELQVGVTADPDPEFDNLYIFERNTVTPSDTRPAVSHSTMIYGSMGTWARHGATTYGGDGTANNYGALRRRLR